MLDSQRQQQRLAGARSRQGQRCGHHVLGNSLGARIALELAVRGRAPRPGPG
jgi:hypothetical protein